MPNPLTILSPVFRQRFFTNNGIPLAGGLLYTYVAGTSTPQPTYTDSTGSAQNANPVVMDANGYADVWLVVGLAYKVVLKDASNNLLWSVDNITETSGSGFLAAWSPTVTYAAGNMVTDGGQIFVSVQNANLNNNPLTDSTQAFWHILGGAIRKVTAPTTITAADNIILLDATSGPYLQSLPDLTTLPTGTRFTVKNVSTNGNNVTINGDGGQQIDGASTYVLESISFLETITVASTGTAWEIVAGFTIPINSIGSEKLESGSVTAVKIAAGAVVVKTQSYATTGTFSFVVPTNVVAIDMLIAGAGGGGGAGGSGGGGGGGGSGGGGTLPIWTPTMAVVPGETLTIVVGTGGARGLVQSTAPNPGGPSSVIGSLASRTCVGGNAGNNGNGALAGGGTGDTYNRDQNKVSSGTGGEAGSFNAAVGGASGLFNNAGGTIGSNGGSGEGAGGGGGCGFNGNGGNGAVPAGAGTTTGGNGIGAGSGGGGGAGSTTASTFASNGGTGAPGFVGLFWISSGP